MTITLRPRPPRVVQAAKWLTAQDAFANPFPAIPMLRHRFPLTETEAGEAVELAEELRKRDREYQFACAQVEKECGNDG